VKLLSAFLYPVKSMRAVQVDALELDARGVVGDRRWMVIEPDGKFVTQRTVTAMTRVQPSLRRDGGLELDDGGSVVQVAFPAAATAKRPHVTIWRDDFDALDAGDEVAAWLSARLGLTVRLVAFAPDVKRTVDVTWARDAETSFTDGYPLLIANETSLEALNAELSSPLPMDRFRPNLVVRHERAWSEDSWTRLTVDGVPFDGVKPCARCVAITTDQRTGERPLGSEPLAQLAKLHTLKVGNSPGAIFGMNLVHRGLGTIRVGAEVSVG
jgi:uncharacterized protein